MESEEDFEVEAEVEADPPSVGSYRSDTPLGEICPETISHDDLPSKCAQELQESLPSAVR